MLLPTLRIGFSDYWPDHNPATNSFSRVLSQRYTLDFNPPHDYLFASVYGNEHMKYNCVKILYIGENNTPDFNWFDYAIGFDKLDFGDRYLRMPNYVYRKEYLSLNPRKKSIPTDEDLLNRGFCSMVVSNNWCADPMREEFFKRLSKYKRIASGGRYLNNVGGAVASKLDFCRKYKFNIAFENSSYPGYVTEKIMDAFAADTVPIYFGDPLINETVNPGCFVRVNSLEDIDSAIERIVALDRDDAAYLDLCHASIFPENRPWDYFYKKVEEFLYHIVEQPLSEAKRCSLWGYQSAIRDEQQHIIRDASFIQKMPRIVRKITRRLFQ